MTRSPKATPSGTMATPTESVSLSAAAKAFAGTGVVSGSGESSSGFAGTAPR